MFAKRFEGPAKEDLLASLAVIIAEENLIVSPTRLRAYAAGWQTQSADQLVAVVLAKDTAQVQAATRLCHEAGIAIIPRGAGTNLIGATFPTGPSVVICTGKMRRVLDYDPVAGLIRVEAGMRNLAVSEHVVADGWFYAPDPSSRKTCTIGGNIGTNSGGSSCLRYGVTVHNLAGLTIVAQDGSRQDLGGAELGRGGLDLAGLICGSEGQLGIVTEALLCLAPMPAQAVSAMLSFGSAAAALDAASAILNSGIVPKQMDFLDAATHRICEAFSPSGYPTQAEAILLLELCGLEEDIAAQMAVLAKQQGQLTDPVVAETSESAVALWAGRHRIYGAARKMGQSINLDCAVPLSQFTAMLTEIRRLSVGHDTPVAVTLHCGDGTVHAFLMYDDAEPGAASRAATCGDAIRLAACALGGSITAEYGVGLARPTLMVAQFSPDDLAVQQRVIRALHGGAFNPDKVFPLMPIAAE